MTTTVAVCALFRNSAKTLGFWRAAFEHQILDDAIDLTFSLVEGDSSDDTSARLAAWRDADPRVTLTKMDVEPILDFDDRVRKWAALGNAFVDGALKTTSEWLLVCESDLCVPADLVKQLVNNDVDVCAPAIWLGGMFYDTWGFRGLDGRKFSNEAPYHPSFRPHGLVEVSSVGSCVLFRRAIFDTGIRFRGEYETGLLAGVCADARAAGFHVFMDSRVAVVHPTSLWAKQQYRLGAVDFEGMGGTPEQDAAASLLAGAIRTGFDTVLGAPDLPENHPIFAGLRRSLVTQLPGVSVSVRSQLHSEARKTYALIVRVAPAPVERPFSVVS